jgi:hypothetical protein
MTPEHECLLQRRGSDKWLKIKAEDYPENYTQKISGMIYGGTRVYSDEWIQFIVALQADGYVTDYGIEMRFKKERKIERMRSILDKCSLSYSVYTKKDGGTAYYIPYAMK